MLWVLRLFVFLMFVVWSLDWLGWVYVPIRGGCFMVGFACVLWVVWIGCVVCVIFSCCGVCWFGFWVLDVCLFWFVICCIGFVFICGVWLIV